MNAYILRLVSVGVYHATIEQEVRRITRCYRYSKIIAIPVHRYNGFGLVILR
jgi:hypothetical protein